MSKRRGHNEGSIYKRADGRWVGVVDLGWQDGKRKRKYLYGDTQEAVVARLTEALNRKQHDIPLPDGRLTVEKLLASWLAQHSSRLTKPLTISTYETVVRLHINPTLGKEKVTKLTTGQVNKLLATKLASGLSPRRVGMIREVLRNALNWAMADDLVVRNVASLATAPRRVRRRKSQFSLAQARSFRAAAQGQPHEALFVTMLALGLRVGEALALKWPNIDDAEHLVKVRDALQRVPGKGLVLVGLKNEESERDIYLPPFLEKLLQEHWLAQKEAERLAGAEWRDAGFVFTTSVGTPLDASRVWRSFKALIREADLPDIRVHDLRGSCGTLLHAFGLPMGAVKGTLGHSQISTTMNVYVGVTDESRRQAAETMDGLLGDSTRS